MDDPDVPKLRYGLCPSLTQNLGKKTDMELK